MKKLKNIIGPQPPPQGAPYAVLFSWTLGGIETGLFGVVPMVGLWQPGFPH